MSALFRRALQSVRGRPLVWTAVAVGLVTALIHGYHVASFPDVIVDEVVYYTVSHSIAVGTGMAFAPIPGNDPFFWQPPLFFLVQSGWLSAFNSGSADLFHAIYAARELNVVIGGLTGALVVVLGARMWDVWAGTIMGLLYALDPFIQRGTRRNMLEPLTGLIVLIAVLLILRYVDVRRRRWLIAAGVAAGLALLTKEIAFFVLVVPFALAVLGWSRRWLFDGIVFGLMAAAVYALYPLWAFAAGTGDAFVGYKLYQLSRFVGIIQATGWNRPTNVRGGGPSYSEALGVNLPVYGSSYALIALGAVMLLGLLLFRRHDPRARLLLAWGGVTYVNFAFIILHGQLNDQFFYLLLLPAAILSGYLVRTAIAILSGYMFRRTFKQYLAPAGAMVVILAIAATQAYGATLYTRDAVLGSDNAYFQAYRFIDQHIPAGQKILVDTEQGRYLYGQYVVSTTRDLNEVITGGIRYFVLSDKSLWGRFDGITPAFHAWVVSNGRELFQARGNTFWTVRVYELVARPRTDPS